MVSPKRLEIIKKKGFPPQKCPKCTEIKGTFVFCRGCPHCSYSGQYHQRVRDEWQPPELSDGESVEAYLDGDEWVLNIVNRESGRSRDYSDWPFTGKFATFDNLETLGIEVIDG